MNYSEHHSDLYNASHAANLQAVTRLIPDCTSEDLDWALEVAGSVEVARCLLTAGAGPGWLKSGYLLARVRGLVDVAAFVESEHGVEPVWLPQGWAVRADAFARRCFPLFAQDAFWENGRPSLGIPHDDQLLAALDPDVRAFLEPGLDPDELEIGLYDAFAFLTDSEVRALGVPVPDVDRRRHHLRVRPRFDAEAETFVGNLEATTGYEGPA